MRRLVMFLLFSLFALTASAQVNLLQVNVGDKNMDDFLTTMATDYAAGKIDRDNFQNEIRDNFGVSSKDVNYLIQKGYNAGDVYLLGMLHKRSSKSIEELIKNRKPGQGWGNLAHQLGIPPSELNKMRVAMKKEAKEQEKGKKKDKYGSEEPEYKIKQGHPEKSKKLGKGHGKKHY